MVGPTGRVLLAGLAAFVVAMAAPAQAMGFHVAPPFLYLSGPVTYEDWPLWQETLERFGKSIDTVVLHDSPGGDAQAGMYIAVNIRFHKLKTVVAGPCFSACANMFIAGVDRQFAARGKSPGLLGFHGTYRESGTLRRKSHGDYYLRMSDWKMSEALILRFINLEDNAGALMFVHPDQRARANRPPVLLCQGAAVRAKRIEDCEPIDGVDALTQGVVTSWDTREVGVLPAPWKERTARRFWDDPVVPAPAPSNDPVPPSN